MHKVSEKAKKFYKKLIWDALDFIERYKESEEYNHNKGLNHIAMNFGYISLNMFNDLKRVHISRKESNLNNIKIFGRLIKNNESWKESLEYALKEKEAIHVIEHSFSVYLDEAREISSKWNNVKAFEE